MIQFENDKAAAIALEQKYKDLKQEISKAIIGQQEVVDAVEKAEKNGKKIGIFYAESLQSCGGQIIYPKGYLRKVYKF